MNQITIRGIPDEIKKIIEVEAKGKGLSINKAIISLLENTAGKKVLKKENKKQNIYHDLDYLFGILTKEEAEELENNLKLQRKIDKELWIEKK